ncbi:hypothetical protein BRADI_1g34625v3 [Brachypodium distachyon]|uniref:Pentacotripeptide-repeat region of PRORP domain-containing protein n=1 Tax=Brachypodium distachyon TaxID=15368 RepID=A0A0Q3JZS0_BRADI|nr:hypothetical protein BRADI_1g34625v3 [Brachypodium distachyon]
MSRLLGEGQENAPVAIADGAADARASAAVVEHRAVECDGRHADPPAAAPSLLTPTVPHFARLLLTQAPAIPPLLTAVLPASPSLLTPHLLLSHSPPLPALSLFRPARLAPARPPPPTPTSSPSSSPPRSAPPLPARPSLPPSAASSPPPASGRELNALLRVFCARGRVAEARALFHRYCDAYPPDTRTFNTLLLGFKEAGHAQALDLFYHDAVLRGFVPDAVSYCVRMDALCKKGRFLDALEMLDEMRRRENCEPTLQVFTTLIYGAGIARDAARARRLFDEMEQCAVTPDRGAHDALMGAYVRARYLQSGMAVMEEMEHKGIGLDDVTYNTMLCVFAGLVTWRGSGRYIAR